MKKFIFLFLSILLFCSVSFSGYSQKSNFVKANLFSPLVRTGSFFYEKVINDDMSGQLGFFFTKVGAGDTKFSGFGITPEFRYYLSESAAPKGIFMAPYMRYQSFSLSVEGEVSEAKLSAFGGGLLVGAQTLLKDVITIEAFFGPAYRFTQINVEAGSESDFEIGTFDGFGVRAGVTVGIGF